MGNNADVKKIGLGQYATGHFTPHNVALDSEFLAVVLDNFVLTYVNCAIVVQDSKKPTRMLLAKRAMEPCPDWWLPGGKVNPGESFEDTAIRNLKKQLGLAINDRSRFQHLRTSAFVWGKRAIAPTENGCHIVSVELVVKVSAEEAKTIKILSEEYCELSWARPEVAVINAGLHLGLVQSIRDLIDFLEKKRTT